MARSKHITLSRRAALAGLVGVIGSAGGASGAVSGMSEPLERELSAILGQSQVPGGSFVAFEGEDVIWSWSYGMADLVRREPMTPDHSMIIASITKTMVAAMVLQLCERGAMRLDDDISAYLPFLVRHPLHPGTAITVRQLLTHTGGTATGTQPAYDGAYMVGDVPERWADFGEAWFSTDGYFYGPDSQFYASWAPGAKCDYSTAPFILLAQAIEVASGSSFFEEIRRSIFEPLNMRHAAIRYADWKAPRKARQYGLWQAGKNLGYWGSSMRHLADVEKRTAAKGQLDGLVPYANYNYPCFGDGGVRTSANELARYAMAWANGGALGRARILSASATAEALRPQVSRSIIGDSRPDWFEQGIGIMTKNPVAPGIAAWGHDGSDIGCSTTMRFDPVRRLGFVYILNTDIRDRKPIAAAIWRWLLSKRI